MAQRGLKGFAVGQPLGQPIYSRQIEHNAQTRINGDAQERDARGFVAVVMLPDFGVVHRVGHVFVNLERAIVHYGYDHVQPGVLVWISPTREEIGIAQQYDQEDRNGVDTFTPKIEHGHSVSRRQAQDMHSFCNRITAG